MARCISTRWRFQILFIYSPYLGKWSKIDYHFSDGFFNHPKYHIWFHGVIHGHSSGPHVFLDCDFSAAEIFGPRYITSAIRPLVWVQKIGPSKNPHSMKGRRSLLRQASLLSVSGSMEAKIHLIQQDMVNRYLERHGFGAVNEPRCVPASSRLRMEPLLSWTFNKRPKTSKKVLGREQGGERGAVNNRRPPPDKRANRAVYFFVFRGESEATLGETTQNSDDSLWNMGFGGSGFAP